MVHIILHTEHTNFKLFLKAELFQSIYQLSILLFIQCKPINHSDYLNGVVSLKASTLGISG